MQRSIAEEIHVHGLASGTEVARLKVATEHLDMTMMEFLRMHKIPVASSCFGEGVCRKCVIKTDEIELMSCLISVKSFLEKHGPSISITYL